MVLIQSLPSGSRCIILTIEGEPQATRRVRELGLFAGTVCTVLRKSPFGGPIEIATAMAHLGIRPNDGLIITVESI